MNGKTALVTGSSRGIGRAILVRVAQEGALVAVHYSKSRSAAEEVVSEIELAGGEAFMVGAELGSLDEVSALYESLDEILKARTGSTQLDILVNNAGPV
ncbi:SDR family NAD(P)-dependent oxidoreductase [Paenibacillus solani]|uniref:SDR family NAD(P)-dependent oxidoreductase n=1 Tax=Paenibacillus solani TaxID=1705565 RepID=UPI003D2E1E47